MTKFGKFAALMLCVVMMFTFASCRTENENVLVYTDQNGKEVAIRSALYMLYQIDATSQYQDEYDEQTTTSVETDTDTDEQVNYEETSIGDKSYNEWVQEKALELCAQHAFIEIDFENAGLTLDADAQSNVESAIEQQWDSYSEYFEKNGIAKSTFEIYITNLYKRDLLFDHYYGKGGSKEVSTDEMGKYLLDNALLVNVLSYSTVTYDESYNQVAVDEATVEANTAVIKSCIDKLNAGEDYASVRAYYFKAVGEEDTADVSTSTAKYPYATVVGNSDTGLSTFEKYDELAKVEIGKAAFFETDTAIALMQRLDMNEDLDYCVESNKDTIIHDLKDDEFDELCNTGAAEYDCAKNDSALKFYRADKLQLETEQ